MQAADKHVVTIHYTLTSSTGEVIDSSQGKDPLPFLFGAGNIIKGLETALKGKAAGDALDVTVAPEDGYGVRNEQLVKQVPRSAFQGAPELKVGMAFNAQSDRGPVRVQITAIEGDTVTVDGNHPLAGQTLHFAVEITEVRLATEEELQHGHVHGPGGHHH